jgi:hypothetical protein
MAWLLIAIGAALLWAGWDALVHLGVVRPLTDRELDRAVLGEGSPRLSEVARLLTRRMVPAHNSLERLLAWLFVIVGAVCVLGGAWLLWSE